MMTDERFTFVEQQRETKSAARGARHRVCGSKSKRCTLPHEYLTHAQMKRRNGIVNTYNMNAPHTKAELSGWSQDLRREYFTGLMQRYCPTDTQLADMLGCSKSTVYNLLTACSVSRENHRQTREQRAAWFTFVTPDAPECAQSDVVSEAIPAHRTNTKSPPTQPQARSQDPASRLTASPSRSQANRLTRWSVCGSSSATWTTSWSSPSRLYERG